MIRILHSVSNMDRAGIETMLMNYYRHMDREKIQFDFLCNKQKKGAYDEEIEKLGGKIYRTPGLNPLKYPKYLAFMKSLFEKYPEYKIVEAHNGALGVYALHAAKKNAIPTRIFHAHGASITKDLKYPLKVFCRSRLKNNITHQFTCGIEAARCYFGSESVNRKTYEFIPNAIEINRFLYNEEIGDAIKEKYGLKGKHVIGHVGRFMTQKNHTFLIDVFEKVARLDDTAVLVLLGDGELQDAIKAKVQEKQLLDRVVFVGNVGNANEWYSAFDIFVLPSIWEGLPVVGVEAQASDLPCVFSDSITREIKLTEKTFFLSLNDSLDQWAEKVADLLAGDKVRQDNTEVITANHYNIEVEAQRLQQRYLDLYEKGK